MTEPHDYRQYDGPGSPPAPDSDRVPAAAGAGGDDTTAACGEPADAVAPDLEATGADLRDRLFYAALAHRETGGYLADFDDEAPDRHDDAGRSAVFRDRTAPVLLRHRTPGGALRRGAPPGQPHPRRIVEGLTAGDAPSAATLPTDRALPAATLPTEVEHGSGTRSDVEPSEPAGPSARSALTEPPDGSEPPPPPPF